MWDDQEQVFRPHQRKVNRMNASNKKVNNISLQAEKHRSKAMRVLIKVYRYMYLFSDDSSIHGFKQLAAKHRHWSEYFFWFVTMVAAASMTIYIVQLNLKRYYHYPTVIIMERDHRDWNITFPTATICPDKKMDESDLRVLAKSKKVKNEDGFVEFFTALANSDFETFSDLPEYDEVSPYDFKEIIVNASFNFTYKFGTTLTVEEEFLDQVLTDVGICYSYNSKIAPSFNPLAILGQMPGTERTQELMYCNTMDGTSFAIVTAMNSGYNVSIGGPYEMPYLGTTFISGRIGTINDIEVGCLAIVSAHEMRTLSVEQRGCRFRSDGGLQISLIYSYNLCRVECRMNLAYDLCKCIPYSYYTQDPSLPKELVADLRDPDTQKKVQCNCLPLCTDFHFTIQRNEPSEWSEGSLKWLIRDYPSIRYKRIIIFGFTDLLVGATAGLFLGCSVLSFVELIYFVTLRLAIYAYRSYKEKQEHNWPQMKKTIQTHQ